MNRTKLLLLFTAFLLSNVSIAQTVFRMEAGTKIKFISTEHSYHKLTNNNVDLFVALIHEINGGSIGKIIPELQYALQSFTLGNVNDAGFRIHHVRFIPQMDIPVHERLSLHTGVSMGYDFATESSTKPEGWRDTNWKYHTNFDLGLIAGVRAFWNDWVLRLRYFHGLSKNKIRTDVFNLDVNDFYEVKYKYRSLEIGLGYTFY